MRRSPNSVPEIECITMLEKLEDAYARKFGRAPFNVSHWDPSEEFHRDMLVHLELPDFPSAINYKFSYQVDETERIVTKLGGLRGFHELLFTPSSTNSILCVLNWLKHQNISQLIVACPAYFSVFHASRRFEICPVPIYMKKRHGGFSLPDPGSKVWKSPSTLWLTSPVYGTSVYLSPGDITFIAELLTKGWTVIADECLALPGQELVRSLGRHPRFLAIYSPHKSLCINGVKFSAVLHHLQHGRHMDSWADVWYGGLGCSSSMAITHFLSDNFDAYRSVFLEEIENQQKHFRAMCAANEIEYDPSAVGHFVSCYSPSISSKLGNSRKFLADLVNATGGSIISGNRSRFSRTLGFSFRVNLTRYGALFSPTLLRIMRYVASFADFEQNTTRAIG